MIRSIEDLKEKLLSNPVVAFIVVIFVVASAAVAFTITIYEARLGAKDDRRTAEVAEVKAEVAKVQSDKSKEEERLTTQLEFFKRSDNFSKQYLEACRRELGTKKELLESISATPLSQSQTPPSQADDSKCQKELSLLKRKVEISDKELSSLRAEIQTLTIDRVKRDEEALRSQVVILEKHAEPARAIGEVDVVLLNVAENSLNVNIEYVINNRTYKSIYIPPKTIVGRRIGSYMYLFEILESDSKTPENASIRVLRVYAQQDGEQ